MRPTLLKGPAIAGWLYDEGELRSYGDIDLLVAPDRFDRAEVVLARLGPTVADGHREPMAAGRV